MTISVDSFVSILKAVELILALCIIPLFVFMVNIANGVKCQLRSDMLHIYYKHREQKVIHQYELENFVYLYKAYKSLRGNSFIDKIYKEVMAFEVIS